MTTWSIIAAVMFGIILIVIGIVLTYALKQAIYIENTMDKIIDEETDKAKGGEYEKNK